MGTLLFLALAIGADISVVALFVSWLRAGIRVGRTAVSAASGQAMPGGYGPGRLDLPGLGYEAHVELRDIDAAHRIMHSYIARAGWTRVCTSAGRSRHWWMRAGLFRMLVPNGSFTEIESAFPMCATR